MDKLCKQCHTIRTLDLFIPYKKGGYRPTCRICCNTKRREYLAKPDVKKIKLEKDAIYRNKPENRARQREIQMEWYKANREEKLRKCYEAEKKRLADDPIARLRKSLRVRLKDAMKGNLKADRTMNLLGCNKDWLRKWIEYQFDDKMNWDNYGTVWHLDHVRPCASFDLKDPEQQRICFGWKNIRPLDKSKNMIKSDNVDTNLISWQEIVVNKFLIENGKNFQGLGNPQSRIL